MEEEQKIPNDFADVESVQRNKNYGEGESSLPVIDQKRDSSKLDCKYQHALNKSKLSVIAC